MGTWEHRAILEGNKGTRTPLGTLIRETSGRERHVKVPDLTCQTTARLGTRLPHVIYVRPAASNEIPGYRVLGIWTVSEGGGRGSIHFLEVHIWEPIKLILALQIFFPWNVWIPVPLQQYQTGLNYSKHFNVSTKSCVELDLDLFESFSVPERPRDILSNQIF